MNTEHELLCAIVYSLLYQNRWAKEKLNEKKEKKKLAEAQQFLGWPI